VLNLVCHTIWGWWRTRHLGEYLDEINWKLEEIMWDFKFSRRRVWCSELSSGIYCRVKLLLADVSEVRTASIIRDDDGGSAHLWNVGRQSFYTTVYPRRQLWTWRKLHNKKLHNLCSSPNIISMIKLRIVGLAGNVERVGGRLKIRTDFCRKPRRNEIIRKTLA
jgi:hypothetical protein